MSLPSRPTPAEPEIRAAGGVVVRGGRVAVVHRPHRADWSLPKGKLDPGESYEQAALREVEEETGLRCTLVADLPPIEYRDHKGRSKRVRYWRMEVVEGEFAPNDEVDELRWLTPADAASLLTYPRDRELVATAFAAGGQM